MHSEYISRRALFLNIVFSFSLVNVAQPQIKDTIIRPTTGSLASLDSTKVNKRTTNAGDPNLKESWREFVNYFRLDFFTTVNAFHYANPREMNSEKNNGYLYYNLNITNQFTTKYLAVNAYFFNELGYRKYFDSISLKNEDNYYYKFDLNSPAYRHLNFNVSYQVKSQFWKSWEYRADTLNQPKALLASSYFSPGYIIYSAGLSYDFLSTSRLELGLVGGQITKVKNGKLYEARNEDVLYGVERGKRKQVEFGLTAQLQMPLRKIGKCFYWENSSRLFVKGKEMNTLSAYQLDLNNGFHFLFLKYMRVGLRTKINYDQTVSEKLYMSNMLLFGFYVSNKL